MEQPVSQPTSFGNVLPSLKMVPGGFWIRFVASIIDSIFTSVIAFPLTMVMVVALGLTPKNPETQILQVVIQVISYIVSIGILIWFIVKKGGGPGKLVMGLNVIDIKTGKNLSYGQAIVREIPGKILSALTITFGFLMAAFREDKRALHDFMGGSRVIRKT